MSVRAVLPVFLTVALAGCASASRPETARPNSILAASMTASEPAPRDAASAIQSPAARSAAITLEAFEVKESAFSDFGMSVKTNVEVQWNGGIEWMQVSGIAHASSASNAGLAVGDRILAIDGRSVSTLTKGEMLDALFGRRKGDSSRVLVLGKGQALPHFVQLVASPTAPASRS